MDDELNLKLHLIEINKMCLDEEARKGCFICGWHIKNTESSGVVLSGDGNEMVFAAADIIDKIAGQFEVPYTRVLKDVEKILKYVQKQRKVGEPLYTVTKIDFDDKE